MMPPTFHFQPVVRLSDSLIVFQEVLMRFANTSISPQCRIASAERSGDIVNLDLHAMNTAIAMLKANSSLALSVNISAISIERQAVAFLDRIHIDGAIIKNRLIVEITESCPFRDLSVLVRFTKSLRALTIPFAIDDYGDGFAELARTLRCRPDYIKLALPIGKREFRYAMQPKLIEVIAIARDVGAYVVVERIENACDLEMAQCAGAEFAQGFFFAEPSSEVSL